MLNYTLYRSQMPVRAQLVFYDQVADIPKPTGSLQWPSHLAIKNNLVNSSEVPDRQHPLNARHDRGGRGGADHAGD